MGASVTAVPVAGQPFHGTHAHAILSPVDGSVLGKVPECGAPEVDRACKFAKNQLTKIPSRAERIAVLQKAGDLLSTHSDALAKLICGETGKPIALAKAEVSRAINTLELSAIAAKQLEGRKLPLEQKGEDGASLTFTQRVPLGVLAAITPFNFPLNLVAHKLGPAIAAGCPVVLKPAPGTPLTALAFVDLLCAAGLPREWISVLTGQSDEIGQSLVEHDLVSIVSFTGSAKVGWSIAKRAYNKKVLLELGSIAPAIVCEGADLNKAARQIANGGFSFAGQSCISVQRVLAQKSVADDLKKELLNAAKEIKAGDPWHEETQCGPVFRKADKKRIESWIDNAKAKGAEVVSFGAPQENTVAPTLVFDAPKDCELLNQEVFGPVVCFETFDSHEEAIDRANKIAFRIHAGVFTPSLKLAERYSGALDFGGVLINRVPTFRFDGQPYGGVGAAGNTREGPEFAAREMTEEKFIAYF